MNVAGMNVNVNKMYLRDMPAEEDLQEAQKFAALALSRMNDRQFLDWLKNLYPEAGSGEVNIGIAVDGGVVHRFRYLDVLLVVEAEMDRRMGAERIRPNQIVVSLPPSEHLGYDPVAAMKLFLGAFQEYANKGQTEPELFTYRDQNPVINADWIDWHSARFSVERKTSWKLAANRIAKELNKNLDEVTIMPDAINPLMLLFVRSIDQHSRV